MIDWRGSASSQEGRISVNVPDRAALLRDIEGRLARGEGFAVATMNLDHAVKLARDGDFQSAYQRHSHVTADGRPIVWLTRLAGRRVSLVTGSDLVDPATALAARVGAPVAFVGSTETSLEMAASELAQRHAGLKTVLKLSPAMGFDPQGGDADAVIEALRASGARLVFLALGAPKQELFAARASASLPHVGFLSVGAGLDFISGQQNRAPRLARALAAEWLWRLATNPRRLWRRYAECIAILPGLTVHALRARAGRSSGADA